MSLHNLMLLQYVKCFQKAWYAPHLSILSLNKLFIFSFHRPGDRDRDRGYRGDRDREMTRGGGGRDMRDDRDNRDRRDNVRQYDQPRDRDQVPIEERMPKFQESSGPVSTFSEMTLGSDD